MATIKKAMKAQKGKTVSPTYKNLPMGVKNENYQRTGVSKDVKPSSSDSARYRGGFEQGMKGKKGIPNEGNIEKMGRWEGQNASKAPKKSKMGSKVKKAQLGAKEDYKFPVLGNKSARKAYTDKVKSGYESGTTPKLEKTFPGGLKMSVDTVGYSKGRERFPAKMSSTKNNASNYSAVNRATVKKTISKQKMGGKTKKS